MSDSERGFDADIEGALDTSDEMTVGEQLARRRASRDKRSISKRHGPSRLGVGTPGGSRDGSSSHRSRRASAVDVEMGGSDDGRSRGVGSGVKEKRRRARRHSSPGFTLSDADSDLTKRERLTRRMEAMRRLPRTSRYAQQQMEIIAKALVILDREPPMRTSNENDELSRLLAAVSL
jgi:hypothetical protein|tara:strand:+ start:136 stop:666 length:531 start_codon:yes stop_codon:yes gene_type:complete|mmetsp:Transcript_1027/g.4212  ORF Transcript_1027/g.4212 Transcript_1027/m.4212 type:complete len:177 (-) Transcript_1027:150-680(-)